MPSSELRKDLAFNDLVCIIGYWQDGAGTAVKSRVQIQLNFISCWVSSIATSKSTVSPPDSQTPYFLLHLRTPLPLPLWHTHVTVHHPMWPEKTSVYQSIGFMRQWVFGDATEFLLASLLGWLLKLSYVAVLTVYHQIKLCCYAKCWSQSTRILISSDVFPSEHRAQTWCITA